MSNETDLPPAGSGDGGERPTTHEPPIGKGTYSGDPPIGKGTYSGEPPIGKGTFGAPPSPDDSKASGES